MQQVAGEVLGMDARTPMKVFICYSRTDTDVTDQVVERLMSKGFEVLIDRRNLAFGRKWLRELGGLIEQSDTIIWMVSDASINSRWCRWELGQTTAMSKRLVPIRLEDIDSDTIPEKLGEVHFLPASGTFAVDDHFDALTTRRCQSKFLPGAIGWPNAQSLPPFQQLAGGDPDCRPAIHIRFPLSLRQVEDLRHERGIDVSHVTVRFWWHRFGPIFAAELRKRQQRTACQHAQWRWHLDEVFVRVNGERPYLWRAVDHEGEVLEVYVTKTRDRRAAWLS